MEPTPQEYINSISLDEFAKLVINADDIFQEMVFDVALKLLQSSMSRTELVEYLDAYQAAGYKAISRHLKKTYNQLHELPL